MERSFIDHGNKLVELLENKVNTNAVFDFQDAMANLTFETICDIAFGVEPGAVRVQRLSFGIGLTYGFV